MMIGVFIVISIFLPSKFLTIRNFQSISSQIPEFGFLAIAMMLAMLTGGIDLSVISIRPGYGSAYLLQAILVCVLGGVDPSGGYGNISGLVMGIITLQILQSGFNILSFSPFFKKVIWGLILILVMVINFYSYKFSQKSKKLKIS
ncbi:hypothetical protein ES705_42044 [subsurface metagenome]